MVQSDYAPANSGDSVYQGDPLIGSVTSGAYGHRVQENVAFAFLNPELAVPGTELEVEILGQRQAARVVKSCLNDPMNLLVKG